MLKLDFKNPIVTIITGIIFILNVTLLINPINGINGSIIIIILGGFIATYLAKERKIRYGLYVGTLSMAIEGVYQIILMNIQFYFGISLLTLTLGIIIIGTVFGTIGGFLGKIMPKNETSESLGYLICDKCRGYYELQEGEFQDSFDKNCDCGGKLEYFDNLDEPIKFQYLK